MIEAFAVVGAALGAAHTSNDPVLLQCFPQLRESALPPSLALVRVMAGGWSSKALHYLFFHCPQLI